MQPPPPPRPPTGLDVPHHDGGPSHVATDAPALDDRVEVRVRVPAAAGVDTVWLRTAPDAEPQLVELARAGTSGTDTWWAGEVHVRNPVTPYRFWLDGHTASGRRTGAWLTAAGVVAHEPGDTTDFRLVADDPLPDWLDGAVLAQVFPDRFARSGRVPADRPLARWDDPVASVWPASMHQWYGGDLYGVAEHLDHLVDLGVTGLYLTPVFPSAENHRYAASDFAHVDPLLGGDEGLAHLTTAAHAAGLRVIGDLTANHSGDDHPWFRAAQADAGAPERAWYRFTDWPDGYESWAGVPTLPKLDHRAPGLREALVTGPDAVAARWLRAPFALDGWRVDAANMAGRAGADDLTHRLARDLREVLARERPDGFLLAEHCHDAAPDLDVPGGWHATMDYQGFTRPVWGWLRGEQDPDLLGWPVPPPRRDGHVARASMDAARARVSWRTHRARVHLLGSHDTTRWRTVAGDRDRARAGLGLLLTVPGVPSILYGDEIGLTSQVHRDTSRVPFPWDDPGRWDASLLDEIRTLVRLRRRLPALHAGGMRWVDVGADHLTFLREHPAGDVLVHVARDAHAAVRLPWPDLEAVHGPPVEAASDGARLAMVTAGVAVHRVASVG
jgi:alpha-glucosidase